MYFNSAQLIIYIAGQLKDISDLLEDLTSKARILN